MNNFNGFNKIILDDDSDNSWKPNNIYLKLSLRYINEHPEPEMKGYIEPVISYWSAFKKNIQRQ